MGTQTRRTRGLRLEWALVGAATAVSVGLLFFADPRPAPGRVVDAVFHLAREDHRLGCASSVNVSGYRCEADEKAAPWREPPPPAKILRPYTATTGTLYLVPALLEQPDIASWMETTTSKKKRFRTECRLKLLEATRDVQTRNKRHEKWRRPKGAWATEIVSCKVTR
jgi:hypothetical protein